VVVEGRKVAVEIDTTKTYSFMNPVVLCVGPAGGGGGEEGDSGDRHDQSGKFLLRSHVGYACCPGPGGQLPRQVLLNIY
jgi:hypothetical protein